ncbi:Serine/threonine-protein phosphatase 7 long form-like [Glycine soja]|uniref:Serine/threonine-protein phosphatase 7 long form-like n=1 Tax=Glycine soja TaxID=3848 RepID=A0A445LZV3_GLYSO|nr:Serine/threonine-protein phosphatase 7 long form-like [Glycine soja]
MKQKTSKTTHHISQNPIPMKSKEKEVHPNLKFRSPTRSHALHDSKNALLSRFGAEMSTKGWSFVGVSMENGGEGKSNFLAFLCVRRGQFFESNQYIYQNAQNKTPSVVQRWLRRGNQHIGNDDLRVFGRKLDPMKRHEPYIATVMAALPPICVVGSVAWFAVVPLICFHVLEWHQPDRVLRQFGLQQPIPGCPSQLQNLHGITLKGKQDENWFHLLAPIISQWNNRAEFRVDVYPRQEGEVVETLQYMVSPQSSRRKNLRNLRELLEMSLSLPEYTCEPA